jgi:hypothetical protein
MDIHVHSHQVQAAVLVAAMAAESALTASLLSQGRPLMCVTKGPGVPTARPVLWQYPEYCSVAPSQESTSEPATPANKPSTVQNSSCRLPDIQVTSSKGSLCPLLGCQVSPHSRCCQLKPGGPVTPDDVTSPWSTGFRGATSEVNQPTRPSTKPISMPPPANTEGGSTRTSQCLSSEQCVLCILCYMLHISCQTVEHCHQPLPIPA